MNNSYRFLALMCSSVLVWVSCTQSANDADSNGSQPAQATVEKTVMPSEDGAERYIATLHIDGMGCAMACGTKISGALAGLDGVQKAEIDFVGAGEVNSAVVSFDASVVTEAEMIRAVNDLKGGHYEVKHVNVVHFTPAAVKDATQEDTPENEKVSVFSPKLDYTLPNIFSVFSRLF